MSETKPGTAPDSSASEGSARKPVPKARRCLVVLPADLGSALWCLSALASLSTPHRLLVVLATEDQMAVLDPTLLQWRLRDHPEHLAVPLTLLRESATGGALAKLHLDEAIFPAPDWSDVGLARKAGIRLLWGFRGGAVGFRLSRPVQKPTQPSLHRSEDLRPLVEAMGADWRLGELYRPETWGRVGKERLEKAKLQVGDKPIVGIYAGGEAGAAWPSDQIEELLRLLRRQNPDWQFVIISTDAELWVSVLLHERTGKIHPVIGPDLSLDGLAAVFRNLDLFVSSESALLQLCALVGTPTLGLFRSDGRRRAPRGARHRHLERNPLKSLPADDVQAVCEIMMARRER